MIFGCFNNILADEEIKQLILEISLKLCKKNLIIGFKLMQMGFLGTLNS